MQEKKEIDVKVVELMFREPETFDTLKEKYHPELSTFNMQAFTLACYEKLKQVSDCRTFSDSLARYM